MRFTGGLPETPCGAGSTLRVTENLRAAIPDLLVFCEARTLIDAPCGDGNWIAHTDLSGVEYCGIDANAEHLCAAMTRPHATGPGPARRIYQLADLRTVQLPPADVILCRDFFQHLPTGDVESILDKIHRAKIRWLWATSFNNDANAEIGPEGFRPLNLAREPFLMHSPLAVVPDPPESGRVLGAWRL